MRSKKKFMRVFCLGLIFYFLIFCGLPAEDQRLAPESDLGSSQVRPADKMLMMYIPAGRFAMGSNDGFRDEQPVHLVYLDAFWIDQTEITNAKFSLCVQDGACREPGGKHYQNPDYAEHPVVFVSWYDAEIYCSWAGARLPTEAEWEKAARGGLEQKTYPWGDESPRCGDGPELGPQYVNCFGDSVPVKSYAPNGFGLYDMAGNVWEWVSDWYQEDYYRDSPGINPPGPIAGQSKVFRGSSWDYADQDSLRAADRLWSDPGYPNLHLGFRCAGTERP